MTQSYRASHSGSQLHFQVFRDVIFAETDDCYAAAAPLRAAAFLPIRINMKETQNQSTSLKRPIRRTLIILATTFILVVSALSILLSYAFVTSIVHDVVKHDDKVLPVTSVESFDDPEAPRKDGATRPKINPAMLATGDSFFDGRMIQRVGIHLLGLILFVITAGLGFPWATCMVYRWETNHTIVQGHRLKFTGKGIQLLSLCASSSGRRGSRTEALRSSAAARTSRRRESSLRPAPSRRSVRSCSLAACGISKFIVYLPHHEFQDSMHFGLRGGFGNVLHGVVRAGGRSSRRGAEG